MNYRQDVLPYQMYFSFVVITLGTIGYYGFEDKHADFFENGNGVTAEYKIRYNKQVYHLGEMVALPALLVTMSGIGIAISALFHLGLDGYLLERRNKKWMS